MSSITEDILSNVLSNFIDEIKRMDVKIELMNDNDTNVDMMLKSYTMIRNMNDSYFYLKSELIKYIHSKNKYICHICGSSYNNPCAYGGHMSKHSKYNMKIMSNKDYYLRSGKDCIVII